VGTLPVDRLKGGVLVTSPGRKRGGERKQESGFLVEQKNVREVGASQERKERRQALQIALGKSGRLLPERPPADGGSLLERQEMTTIEMVEKPCRLDKRKEGEDSINRRGR